MFKNMIKILLFNIIVGLICAAAWNYAETGDFGLNWSYLEQEQVQIENVIANVCEK